jgi:outer membrane protein assembly factor BamB
VSEYRDNAAPLPEDRSILVVAQNGRVYGVDRVTGAVRWENNLDGGGYGEVFLCVGYGVVVVSAFGSKLFCLAYLTGTTRWEQRTSASGRAAIVIEPDQIVCAKGGYIDCFAPDGQKLWEQPLSGAGTGRGALGYPANVAQADDRGNE